MNALSSVKQIPERPPNKESSLTTYLLSANLIRQQRLRFAGYCWCSKEAARDILLWIPSHRKRTPSRLKMYIDHLMEDTGCRLDEIPNAMNDRNGWKQHVIECWVCSTLWWRYWYIGSVFVCYMHILRKHLLGINLKSVVTWKLKHSLLYFVLKNKFVIFFKFKKFFFFNIFYISFILCILFFTCFVWSKFYIIFPCTQF